MNSKKNKSRICIIGGMIAIVCGVIALVVRMLVGMEGIPYDDITLLIVGSILIVTGNQMKDQNK